MKINKCIKLLAGVGLVSGLAMAAGISYASAFQIWEQNGAGTGDYHSGAAAEANDASTTWYNPAGLTRLKHPQVVAGAVGIHTDIPYKGTVQVAVPSLMATGPVQTVSTQGGGWNGIPFGYVAIPFDHKWAFGFGVLAPFGLDTDYGDSTALKYAATETSIKVVDVTPAVAYQLNKVVSFGIAMDAMHIQGDFDQYGLVPGAIIPTTTESKNSGSDWGVGAHFGALFQFTKNTRVGISYHTQVVTRLTGTSKFTGPLANGLLVGGTQTSTGLNTKVTLPAFVALGGYEQIDKQWAVLGTATYTFWDSFDHLILNNVAAFNSTTFMPTNTAKVTIAENFRNTWNFALGVHFSPVQKLTLKGGVGYDQSPTRDSTRNVQLPDGTRVALAFGIHYQVIKNLGVDLGYTHLFVSKVKINNVQNVAGEIVTTHGNVKSAADVVGMQITWNFV